MACSLAIASAATGVTPIFTRSFARNCLPSLKPPIATRWLLARSQPSIGGTRPPGLNHLQVDEWRAAASRSSSYAVDLLDVLARRGGDGVFEGSRDEYNAAQATFVADELRTLGAGLPEEMAGLVQAALGGVSDLGAHSRVIVVGSIGQQALQVAAAVQAVGVLDVLAVDVCREALAAVPQPDSTCGNDLQLRTWVGDFAELPDYLGGADLVVFCGSLGRMYSVRDALLRCSLILKPGGRVAVCEPLGYGWQSDAAEGAPVAMPHKVPRGEELLALLADLALEVERTEEAERWGFALLRVPRTYGFRRAPLLLAGDVTTGFGRGSRDMGVPTANLPPEPLADQIENLPNGVYFGWAKLMDGEGEDAGVKKMVMNIGERPTCEDGGGRTVEVHIMHTYDGDFYGRPLRALALAYLRPEMRFAGFGPLVARIRTDIGVAKYMLDEAELAAAAEDPFFD